MRKNTLRSSLRSSIAALLLTGSLFTSACTSTKTENHNDYITKRVIGEETIYSGKVDNKDITYEESSSRNRMTIIDGEETIIMEDNVAQNSISNIKEWSPIEVRDNLESVTYYGKSERITYDEQDRTPKSMVELEKANKQYHSLRHKIKKFESKK